MKRGTSGHWKTLRLTRALGCPRAQAVGHLHLLWEWASTQARSGDVGRFADEDIEAACLWDGERGRLVRAFIDERWLDRHADPAVRLVVHDWPSHCEDSVHKALARACLRFADGSVPKLGGLTKDEKVRAERAYGIVDSPTVAVGQSVGGQSNGDQRSPVVAVAVALALANRSTSTDPPNPPAARGGAVAIVDRVIPFAVGLGIAAFTPGRRRELIREVRAGKTEQQLRARYQALADELADEPPDPLEADDIEPPPTPATPAQATELARAFFGGPKGIGPPATGPPRGA